MHTSTKDHAGRTVLLITMLAAMIAVAVSAMKAQGNPPAKPDSATGSKTAEQAFKNIKVLKTMPADQLIPAMQFIAASLGTGCNHCHVEGHFDQDDKKPKEMARKMMAMMFAINKDNFDGHREVTCNSCHNGSLHPAGIPPISDNPQPMMMAEANPEKPDLSKLPSASDIVDKYVQAIGGSAAVQKISSRTAKGTITGFGGRKSPVEIFSQGTTKTATITHSPNGDTLSVYSGTEGWTVFPNRPARPMEGAELDAARLDADLHFPVDIKTIFTDLKVASAQKIGDRDVYQVRGMRDGFPRVELYFDQQTGLLVREVRYAESPLGLYPTRIDYSDYREQDEVKIPFTWSTLRPTSSQTVQLEQVQQNVPIDDAKFAKPPAQ